MVDEIDATKDTPDDPKTTTREPKNTGGETIKISLKRLVDGWRSLSDLAARDLTMKANYAVSKVYGKVEAAIKVYDKKSKKIITGFGGTYGPMGPVIDKTHDNYQPAMAAMEAHEDESESTEIELTGIIMIKMEDLFAALPARLVKADDSDRGKDVVEDKSRLSSKIVSDLDWLILPPEE